MAHTIGSECQPIMINEQTRLLFAKPAGRRLFETNVTLMDVSARKKVGRKRKTKEGDKCQVCGDPAIGLNFGVQTCSPCKAFFRRNAVKLGTTEFQCRDNGDCPMTGGTRRQCNCCRLAKCFRVGMDRRAIRTDDQRQERLRLIEANRQKRRQEKSDVQNSLAIPNQSMIRPSGLLLHSTTKSDPLSPNDYALLTNIFHQYQRSCTSYTYKEHVNMPVDDSLTLPKFLNASTNMYMSFIAYLQSIPEFRAIPVDAKISLFKSNFAQVFFKQSTLIIQTVTPDLMKDSPVFLHLFPKDIYMDMRQRSLALYPFSHDPILMKLYLIILMFSAYLNIQYDVYVITNTDVNTTRMILSAQNVYIDLLWRYLLSRCSSYQQSVQMLTSLVSRTLHSQKLQVKVNNFVHTHIANEQEQLAPLIQSLWASNEKIHS